LRPLAGPLTFLLFSAGIIGTGLLAVPVLAGSAAYAVAETAGWEGSLEMPARNAPGFYLIVAATMIAGLTAALTPLDPIRMLFWSAVFNGIVAVPLMIAMMFVVTNRKIMGKFTASPALTIVGSCAAALMAVVVALMFLTSTGADHVSTMPLDEPESSEWAAPCGRARYACERISIRREAVRLNSCASKPSSPR
jgi:Mn2+/Fe2+ NRAMP family transporter